MRQTQDWKKVHSDKLVSAKKAVADIKRGQRVFLGSGAAEPQSLVAALSERGERLADNEIVHVRTLDVAPYTHPRFSENFRYNTFFIGETVRDAVNQGRGDYTPIFLSELPLLFRRGKAPVDVALIQVSPPDGAGFCSYGVSVDITKAAAEGARRVVAEVNPQMPRTLGDSFIHVNDIDMLVAQDAPLLELQKTPQDKVSQRIGQRIADLVEDGSTLQMGIGSIPDSVLAALTDRRHLGVHTEMLSDGIVQLIEAGAVTGARKTLHKGKVIASFALGTHQLYDFVDDNPMFEFYPNEYSNDPFVIAQNRRMVAINSGLEVDLTGQVCSDSLGTYFYSGIGGQVDFIRGAARSEDGKPIIAVPSTVEHEGERMSRIVATLKPGAGVVTSRGDVHWIVTEYGAEDLHGKCIRERALALIHLAHPDYREDLMREARERRLVYSDQVVVEEAGLPELEALRSTFTLEDGLEIFFRPVQPTDEALLQDLFYRSSEQTIYMRFMSYLKALPHRQAQKFVDVDYHDELALVGTVEEGERNVIVGVGRYHRDPATDYADCAFLVRDDWQGRGIGRYLVERLIEVARTQGIKGFTADVLASNTRMMHVFHQSAPATIQSQSEDGSYHIWFSLQPDEEEGD